MFSLLGIAEVFERKIDIFNLLSASMVVIILIDPLSIYNIGFWLSHLAVCSIILFYPFFNRLLTFRFIVFRWLWSLIALSLSAQLGTFPLAVFVFNYFPTYFIVTNLFLVPLVAPVLILSIGTVFFQSIPFIATMLVGALQDVIWFMNETVAWIEQLPWAVFFNLSYQWFDIAGFYFLIIFFFLLIDTKRLLYLKYMLISMVFLLMSIRIQSIMLPKYGIIVAHNKNRSVVNYFSPTQNEVFIDDSLSNKEIEFCLAGYWARFHAPVNYSVCQITNMPIYKQIGEKKVVILPKGIGFSGLVSHEIVEWLICSEEPKMSLGEIQSSMPFDSIAITGAWNDFRKKKWLDADPNLNKLVYDVASLGGLVILNE